MGRLASHRLLRRLQLNPDLHRLLAELAGSECLSDEDARRLSAHLRGLFSLCQEIHLQRSALDETVWTQIHRVLAWLVLTPGVLRWWSDHVDAFDPAFADVVDSIREGAPFAA